MVAPSSRPGSRGPLEIGPQGTFLSLGSRTIQFCLMAAKQSRPEASTTIGAKVPGSEFRRFNADSLDPFFGFEQGLGLGFLPNGSPVLSGLIQNHFVEIRTPNLPSGRRRMVKVLKEIKRLGEKSVLTDKLDTILSRVSGLHEVVYGSETLERK